jgi:hypothetical protein
MKLRIVARYEAKKYRTKTGLPLDFSVIYDSEGNKNRGWQVDEYTASIKGSKVGYLKVAYIPRKRFEEHFPNLFFWLDKIKGWSLGLRTRYEADEPDTLDLKSEEFWKRFVTYADLWEYRNGPIPDLKIRMQAIKKVEKKYKKEFQQFIDFHVDKPLVDFIRTRNDVQWESKEWGDQERKDWRRNGISLALYEYAARDLGKRGLVLYASSIQRPEAAAAWEQMKKLGYPIKSKMGPYGKMRFFLDYRQ